MYMRWNIGGIFLNYLNSIVFQTYIQKGTYTIQYIQHEPISMNRPLMFALVFKVQYCYYLQEIYDTDDDNVLLRDIRERRNMSVF